MAKKIMFLLDINIMISNRLLPQVKIPLEIARGTVLTRQQKAEACSDIFYKELLKLKNNDENSVSCDQIISIIKKIKPFESLAIDIEKNNDEIYEGSMNLVINNEKNCSTYKIIVEKLTDIPTLVHEFHHISDHVFHPKFLSRMQILIKKGLETDKYINFYNNFYYSGLIAENKQEIKYALKFIENKTRKFLKGFSVEDKINYLQDIRYNLLTECNAYKKQIEVAEKLKKLNYPINENDLYDCPKVGFFEEKVKLLNKLLKETITKERGIMRAKCKKANEKGDK